MLNRVLDFIQALAVFLLGTYLFFKYMLPKMSRDTAIATAEAIVKHPKVQPWLRKAENFMEKIDEVDIQELVDLAKGVKVFIELQTNNQEPPKPKSPDQKTE